jgi:hypothetical protein
VGLAVIGCDPRVPEPKTPAPTRDFGGIVATAPVKRYIGVSTAEPSPPPGWTIRALNAGCGGKGGEECFYLAEFDGSELSPSAIEALGSAFGVTPGDATMLAPDLPVVATAGALTPALHDAFAESLSGGVGKVSTSSTDVSVTLAVVDTYLPLGTNFLSADPATLGNTHGFTLLALAHQLVCGGNATCPVRVESWGGLPFVPPGNTIGSVTGSYGTFGTVGEAIQAGLVARADPPATTQLVLNLSLGWHPSHGGDPANRCEWPAPMRFLHSQILAARNADALVVVAAGNRTGSAGGGDGALYPAAWRVMGTNDRTTPGSCADGPGGGEKLLWSVGAVDAGGRALPLGRAGGFDLTAYGDHAVTTLGGDATPALTGTSVSATVVSAAAAVTWASLLAVPPVPNQTPSDTDVIGAVYAGTGSNDPGWVHMCRGVQVAQGPYACAELAAIAPAPPAWPEPSNLPQLQATTINTANNPSCSVGTVEVVTLTTTTTAPAKTVSWCPEDELFSQLAVAPWVRPQPDVVPCPPCAVIARSGLIDVFVDDTDVVDGANGMSDVSIQLMLSDGTQRRFWIDPALVTAAPWGLTLGVPGTDVVGARLVAASTNGSTQTSVIMPLAVFAAPSTP